MNRYGWILLRAYLPAAAALVFTIAFMLWTSVAGSVNALNTLVPVVKWLPPLALLVALVSGGIATVRMWRWQRGQSPVCAGCQGPLGRVRHGPRGDYRKCLACGGKQAE